MGAKSPANVKEKRLTCEECQREFMTIQALKSHTMAKHPEKYKQMQKIEAESKDEKKTAFVPPTSRVSKRLQQKKSTDREIVDSNISNLEGRKTTFECPECLKLFKVYFSAHKHIQKRHCEDKDGNPVSPDSPDLIKPVRKEMCTVCTKVISGDKHFCEEFSSGVEDSYVNGTYSCLGCKQSFRSVAIFDNHVASFHFDNVDSMFFESYNEFQLWKSNMESQVKVKYLSLSNTTQKQYYQCNYVSPKNSADITHLCPSILMAREFSKGVQVHYFKKHYEHTCEYKIPSHFEDNVVESKTGNIDIFNSAIKSDDNLYLKFRNLLKSIILGAAKVKLSNLKSLYSVALEMQICLNSFVDDHKHKQADSNSRDKDDKESIGSIDNDNEEELTNEENIEKVKPIDKKTDTTTHINNMTDDEITKALEAPRASARLKRKSTSSAAPASKKNKVDSEKDISQTKSDINEHNSMNTLTFESPKVTKRSPISQSPSFNDSYKEFIGTSLKVNKKESSPSSKKINKKEVVKTKIGQFIPSPKKPVQMKEASENVDIITVKKKKKGSMKSPQTSIADIKLEDVEYEVVEQENDCNILVLKI